MSAWISNLFYRLTFENHLFGMRGLSNYCLSCCVNSLLQTFSATWEIAELLERWDAAGARGDARNVALHLKRVLEAMQGDLPQPAPHRDFLHCLDQNRFRLNVQHDADEVFLSILNFIHQQMDNRVLVGLRSNYSNIIHFCMCYLKQCLFEFALSERLGKFRICTRFQWRHTCSV